jgi:MFS family permease
MAAVIVTIQIGVFQIFKPSPAVLLRLFGPFFTIALLTIALAPNLTIMTIGYGMIGFGFAFATPGINGGASLIMKPHEQGAAAGYLAAATTVGPILGPIAGMALFTLGPTVPILTGAAIFIVLSLYAFTVRVPKP